MRRLFVAAIVGMTLSGCAAWSEKSRLCFSDEPPINPVSDGEKKAVASVKKRVGADCRLDNIECNLQLRRGDAGEIEVIVTRAEVVGNPASCSRLEGGFETYVFSPEGEYVRTDLGL